MPWQKVVGYVRDGRIQVESKSGKQYPVATEYDHIGRDVYRRLNNINATEHKRDYTRAIWAWVNYDADPTVVEYLKEGDEADGPPENPPWVR